MNKKFLIILSIFFSFLFVGNVSALTVSGVELNQEFFDNGWEVLEGTRYNNRKIYHQEDFPYVFCHNYTNTINCGFLPDYTYFNKTSSYVEVRSSVTNTSTYQYAPAFSYNKSSHVFTKDPYGWNGFYLYFSSTYSNFDVYNGDTKVWSKSFDYSLAPTNYVINFHLNGSEVLDVSDIMNPEYIRQDFSVSLTSDELHDYITHLTFMKPSYDYLGLYYDSEYTELYSSTDIISSDIDLYVKFEPKFININDVDYIEFKFDDLPLTSTNISFDYHFKTVTSNGLNETIQFSQPFGREYYTGCDDENQNCSPTERYKDSLYYDLDYINYDYSGSKSLTFNSEPEHITNSYSVIVPTESLRGTYLYYDFNSEQDYEMIIHYKSDEGSNSSYIRTVDITGKYGVVFLPLYDNTAYVDEGSYYLTKFKVVGNVDIQVTDSREMTGYNILQIYSMNYCNNKYLEQANTDHSNGSIYLNDSIPYSCDNTSGVFNFKINNLTAKQTLRFVNHSYTELSNRTVTIDYDSRYFNYGILDTPYSTVDIEDPTTHEIETVGLSEFYRQLDKESIEGSKIGFKTAFQHFVYPIKFIFKHITKLYNNYLNSSMQHYFFIVFSLTLVILIIRVIF